MEEYLKRLFEPDYLPHGHFWRWEPWLVWSNVLADSAIALCYTLIAIALCYLARRRQDRPIDRVVMLLGVFIFACACSHAMEVLTTWSGVFRLAGAVKVAAAGAGLVATAVFLRLAPKLLAAPSLNKALAMDAALTTEKQEKQRAEGRLREVQDRFRLLVEGIQDYALVLLDPNGLVTSWNPGAARITGYTDEEIMGQPFSGLFPPEELAAGRPEELLTKAAARGRIEYEGWRVRKDGTRFFVNEVINAFYDEDGILQGFAKATRDITEQRATQAALQGLADSLEDQVRARVQELRESEARLMGFIRHASAAIAFKGPDRRYLFLNPRMEVLLGRPAGEITGRTIEEVFPEEACVQVREREARVLDLRQDVQTELRWTREDGSSFDLLAHEFPLVDATGQCCGMGTIITDITERKQADLALLRSQKLESLGVLAGGVAHDFNNLLGAVQGNVELAMTEASLATAQPYLMTVMGLLSKASDLLRQMLAYAGKGRSSVRALDLNQLVREMIQLLGSSISKKATIRLELHREPPLVAADPAQLQQVVMNLVINASEALGEQSGTITIRTGLEELSQGAIDRAFEGQPLSPGPHAALEVADDGEGMSSEVLKKIFDPFFTTKFTGRGLGLAAIQGIVRGHQGGIRVFSEPGQGSLFQLRFPAIRGPACNLAQEAPAPTQSGAGETSQGTILVVDDEEEMRMVAVQALERAGFRTRQARDGREALELFQEHRDQVRLILMDLTMPNLDGREALRELRRQGARVPVLLTSGFNESEVLPGFEGLGLTGFLQKPFGLGALVEQVVAALGD